MISRSLRTSLIVGVVGLSLGACATTSPRFSGEVVWEVNDRRPIDKPDERWAPKYWTAADALSFRPITRALQVPKPEAAKNVNAWGHVPNSSWYTNRFARYSISPKRTARGTCSSFDMSRGERWVVTGGKIGGNNPGFFVEVHQSDGSAERYLLKFDGENQTERATAADVVGSRIYWAAGFEVPCNRIVYFDTERLVLADDATKKNRFGQESPLERSDLRKAMKHTPRLEDGRVRALASKFLPGEPLGPFSYVGTRKDDPNDVIPHEDRRELRGSRLLAAWINHFDAREQNTFTSFITGENAEKGYVQHFMLDFGDSFGSHWGLGRMSRRFGHSWYVDWPHMAVDLLSLGMVQRPWHDVRMYDNIKIFGYYDIAHFDPEEWKAGYPNIAFQHMDDRDAFWATNIISRFSDAHIRRIVDEAKFTKPLYARYLTRMLIGRRNKIVETYFKQMTPVVEPRATRDSLCVTDAWVACDYGPSDHAFYRVGITPRGESEELTWRDPRHLPASDGRLCIDLPDPNQRASPAQDLVVRVRIRRMDQREPARPARFHLRLTDDTEYRVVGILRAGNHP